MAMVCGGNHQCVIVHSSQHLGNIGRLALSCSVVVEGQMMSTRVSLPCEQSPHLDSHVVCVIGVVRRVDAAAVALLTMKHHKPPLRVSLRHSKG